MARPTRSRPQDMADRLALARSYTKNGSGGPLSTSALARLAGLVRTHVYLIESRKRTNFTIDTIAQLADVLGVSIDWLYAGKGLPPDRETVLAAVRKCEAAAETAAEDAAAIARPRATKRVTQGPRAKHA